MEQSIPTECWRLQLVIRVVIMYLTIINVTCQLLGSTWLDWWVSPEGSYSPLSTWQCYPSSEYCSLEAWNGWRDQVIDASVLDYSGFYCSKLPTSVTIFSLGCRPAAGIPYLWWHGLRKMCAKLTRVFQRRYIEWNSIYLALWFAGILIEKRPYPGLFLSSAFKLIIWDNLLLVMVG